MELVEQNQKPNDTTGEHYRITGDPSLIIAEDKHARTPLMVDTRMEPKSPLINVLLVVDNGMTNATQCAFQAMLQFLSKLQAQSVMAHLLTVTTSLDLLNEEKNAASLELASYELRLREQGFTQTHSRQLEALDTNAAIFYYIEDAGISQVFIGENSFSQTVETTNLLLSLGSMVKRVFVGSTAGYIQKYFANSQTKIHVVPSRS